MPAFGFYQAGFSNGVLDDDKRCFFNNLFIPTQNNVGPLMNFEDFFQLIYRRRRLRIFGDCNGISFDDSVAVYGNMVNGVPIDEPADERDLLCRYNGAGFEWIIDGVPLISFRIDFSFGLSYFDAVNDTYTPQIGITFEVGFGNRLQTAAPGDALASYTTTFLGYDIPMTDTLGSSTGSLTIEAPATDGYWEFQTTANSAPHPLSPTWDKDTGDQLLHPVPPEF